MKMSKIVSVASIGNALEIYDVIIYGLLAPIIAKNFFPNQEKLNGIASVFAIFFLGYLARPLGALLFGRMGDTLGRKPTLIVSIWLMTVSTALLGLLPTYQMIGVWAPLLLLILRILQGFSLGGEYPGSIILVVEHAPTTKRGFYGSFADAGGSLGILLASFVSWLVHINFSDLVVVQWAWRLPFLLGLLIGLIGGLIRRDIPETQLFEKIRHRAPVTHLAFYRKYAQHMRQIATIIAMIFSGVVIFYLFYVFSITYMTTILSYTQRQALSINILSIILLFVLEPCMDKLSDHIGRRPVMILAIFGIMLWIWPYYLLQQHSITAALLAQGVVTLFTAAYFAVVTVIMVEIVPVYIRFGVVAIAYALAASIFGGGTPLVATLLLKLKHPYVSLALYIDLCLLISLIAVYKVRETKGVPLS